MAGLTQPHIRLDEEPPVTTLDHHIVVVQRSSVCGDTSLHTLRQVREVKQGGGREVQFGLTTGHKSRRGCLAEVCRTGTEA